MKFFMILALALSSVSTTHAETIIKVRKAESYQLNPVDPSANAGIFNYKKVVEDCFASASIFDIDYSRVTSLINKRIKASQEIPTISCTWLIEQYRADTRNL
jgi:hypothetical protein